MGIPHHTKEHIPTLLMAGLLIFAAALQTQGFTLWFGVTPNLMLAVLTVAALFITNTALYVSTVLIGLLLLAPRPGITLEVLVFGAIILSAYYVLSRRITHALLGVGIVIFAATVLFYVIIDPRFLVSHPYTVALEAVYTIGIAILIFELMQRVQKWLR